MKKLVGLVSIALMLTVSALAQNLRLAEALDGKSIPATIKPSELSSEYWAVKVTFAGEFSLLDLYGGAAFQFSGEAMDERGRAREALLQSTLVHWTRGDKVIIEGQPFLVMYKLDVPLGALSSSGSRFETWALENPLELTLQLVRPDGVNKLAPVPTMTPDKMAKAVAAFQQTLKDEFGTEQLSDASLSARRTAAISNAKQIALGIIMYSTDYDDKYPSKQSTDHVRNVTMPYIKNSKIWTTGNPNKSRFLFNVALSGHTMMEIAAPAEMVMVYEDIPWPDGKRVVAYADGHVKAVSGQEWNTLQKTLKWKPKPPPKKGKPPK